jgi:DNA-binding transcriptional MocR family regulator
MELNFDLNRDIPVLDWTPHLASRTEGMKSSVIRELLKLTQQPDIISFAGGMPASELFPLREVDEACRYIIREDGPKALQYSATEGHGPLKEYLATMVHKYGVPAVPDNVLLINGSQQALDLIGKIFIDPGDYVLTGRPTYLGATQAWNAYRARYHTVRLDDDGMVVDEIEHAYEKVLADSGKPPKFIYVLPNFHNPAGTTMPVERRQRLAEVATKLDLPVLIRRFVQAKQGADLHTSTFVQYVANDICQRGLLKPHVRRLCQVYRERRDTMLDALAEFWPEGCSWTRPQGGLFLWVLVPESINTADFMETALVEKVAYVPGVHFYPNQDGGHNAMRLNFSYCPPDVIVEGIHRLGVALKKELGY